LINGRNVALILEINIISGKFFSKIISNFLSSAFGTVNPGWTHNGKPLIGSKLYTTYKKRENGIYK
jgi:hypothetical protein